MIKIFIGIGMAVVIILLSWLFLGNSSNVVERNTYPTPTPTSGSLNNTSPKIAPSSEISPSIVPKNNNFISYTDNGYVPAVLKIKKGEIVTWENKSSRSVWTASDPHPVHTGYPLSGGCLGSVFDECHADAIGTTWNFKFDKVGSWGYHNHVYSWDKGMIIVQ